MNKLSNIEQNFTDWYQDVIFESGLVDTSPTKGCFVLRPYGYALWEHIQTTLDKKIKATGTQNAYFPLLIPESFIAKEKKHVEGFSPELAVVTYAGGEKLEESYVVRPTSETIIYYMFSRWIKSWRDLPLKVNQWASVVRWEMRPRAFLRSIEFLWQEGHTAHATHEEAVEMTLVMLENYKNMFENYLAIPVVSGIKSDSERFAGAERTYTLEGLMPDGKALQMCTSHVLAHSFPESFEVKFQAKDGSTQIPYCSSWGFTTRSIGALVMTHGDQQGLVMPPRIAPIQAVIVPIFKTDLEKDLVFKKANDLKQQLENSGMRVVVDMDEQASPGAKFYAWELKGVPVRIELGPKDLEKQQAVLVNRAEPDKNKKKLFVPLDTLVPATQDMLEKVQELLYARALERMKSMWYQVEKLETFSDRLDQKGGFYQTGWCGNPACEAKLKNYKGTIRCLLDKKEHSFCFGCAQSSKSDVLVAKAY
jgi:prolyl-tRNA synthetase